MGLNGHHHDHGAEGDERRSFVAPDSSRRDGPRGADTGDVRLAALYDATLDGCPDCWDPLLDAVARDPLVTADLVNWACVVTGETYGEIPDAVLEDEDKADVFPEPFRVLARVYQGHFMAGTDYTAMLGPCTSMSSNQRREAAATAVTLVVGLGDFGIDYPFE